MLISVSVRKHSELTMYPKQIIFQKPEVLPFILSISIIRILSAR